MGTTINDLILQYADQGAIMEALALAKTADRALTHEEMLRLKEGCIKQGLPCWAAEAAKMCSAPLTTEEVDRLVDNDLTKDGQYYEAILKLGASVPAQDRIIQHLLEKNRPYSAEHLACQYGSRQAKISIVNAYVKAKDLANALKLARKLEVLADVAERLIMAPSSFASTGVICEILRDNSHGLSADRIKTLLDQAIYRGSLSELLALLKALQREATPEELERLLAREIQLGYYNYARDTVVLLRRELTAQETVLLMDYCLARQNWYQACVFASGATTPRKAREHLLAACLNHKQVIYALQIAALLQRPLTEQELSMLSPDTMAAAPA